MEDLVGEDLFPESESFTITSILEGLAELSPFDTREATYVGVVIKLGVVQSPEFEFGANYNCVRVLQVFNWNLLTWLSILIPIPTCIFIKGYIYTYNFTTNNGIIESICFGLIAVTHKYALTRFSI